MKRYVELFRADCHAPQPAGRQGSGARNDGWGYTLRHCESQNFFKFTRFYDKLLFQIKHLLFHALWVGC
jgi:hypothetical protein